MALLEVEGLTKSFGALVALRGVSFSVEAGEVLGLAGPNGSGKSTLAKTALGVIKPDEGTLNIEKGARIGYVPQKFTIEKTIPMTVNRLMCLTARQDIKRVEAALDQVGMSGNMDADVQTLSGGELQRVLLARAVLHKPEILVLDEPAQGVDFAGEREIYDLIRVVRDQTNCGVLLISHDLHLVMAETDTVICLNGHVCCTGSPEAVSASQEYLQLFGPRAVEGLAFYRHHHDHTHLPDGTVRHADGSVTDHCHPDDGHHQGASDQHQNVGVASTRNDHGGDHAG